MAYKIAGIDVHKKVLMVVVIDGSMRLRRKRNPSGDDLPPYRVTCSDY